MRDSSELPEVTVDERWFRFGLLLAIANLAFIFVLLVLLQIDPVLGLGFAFVVGLAGGVFVMLYALRRM